MKTTAIIGLILVALFLALIFAAGGAGIYGSPFGSGTTAREYAIYGTAILVGPLASLIAFWFRRRLSRLSGGVLIMGAVIGSIVGLLVKSDFAVFWGKVFAVAVWLPMFVVGASLFLVKD